MVKKIAIASGKGGTGKTFVSTNLFKTIENSGIAVTFADCDAEVPDSCIFLVNNEVSEVYPVYTYLPIVDRAKCVYCGKCAEYCAFNALTCIPEMEYIKVNNDLCHSCRACEYACQYDAISSKWREVGAVSKFITSASSQIFEGRININNISTVAVIRDTIKRATVVAVDREFPKQGDENIASCSENETPSIMLIDSPPGCSCPFVNAVMDADFVILVAEPTPFGINDLRQTIAVLEDMDKPFSVIINRSDIGDGSMLKYLKSVNVDLLASIPYSEKVAEYYSAGLLVCEQDERFKKLFVELMHKLLAKF